MTYIPITSTTQPKIGFSFFPSIFFESKTPTKIPEIDSDAKVNKNCQSTNTESSDDVKPIKEFKAIMNNDVATASFMLIFKSITNAGTIKNPPPAPINPVIIPTKSPWETNRVKLVSCDLKSLCSLIFLIIL